MKRTLFYRYFSIAALLAVAAAGFLPFMREANAFYTPVSNSSNTFRFENISIEDGLSNETVHTILQDHEGYMWFGTLDGLNKYNGYDFIIYRHDETNPNSLADSNILTLFEDQDNTLWIGTSLGLDRFNRRQRTFTHFLHNPAQPNSLSGRGVSTIFQDHDGQLWVGTSSGGLNRYDPQSESFISYQHDPQDQNSLSSNAVQILFEDHLGRLWVGTVNGLNLFHPESKTFTRYMHNPLDKSTLAAPSVTAICEDGEGNLWIGTQGGGLELFNPALETFVNFRTNPDHAYSLSGDSVNAIHLGQNEDLWIGTNAGLERMDLKSHYFYDYPQLPPAQRYSGSEAVSAIFEDRSSILWIASVLGGVSKYNPVGEQFKTFDHQENELNSLSSSDISSIITSGQNIAWIGTFDGGLNRLNTSLNSARVFRNDPDNPNSLASDKIFSMIRDRRGMLWIGTSDKGLDRFDPITETFFHFQNDPKDASSLSENQITCLLEDQKGNIWAGTYSSGINILNRQSGTISQITFRPNSTFGLNDNHIVAMFEDGIGQIWIGTWSGINIYNPETHQFTTYSDNPEDPNSLSENFVNDFYEDSSGNMWIATNGGGLENFNRSTKTFNHFTQQNGLPSDTVFGILPAKDGTLWLSTGRGISQFSPFNKSFRNFDTRDGLLGNQFNPGAFHQDEFGNMYFGGINGLTVFNPLDIKINSNVPPIVITRLSTLNRTISTSIIQNEQFQLSPDENYLSFEFSALEYSIPEKNQYAYQMLGVDDDWIYTTPSRRYENQTNFIEGIYRDWYYTPARRTADYSNLQPGDYIFQVMGANNDGVWNTNPARIYITIAAPIWERTWFRLLLAFGLIGTTAGVWALRTQAVQRRQILFESEVEERTSAIERRQRAAEGLRDILTIINSDQPLNEILNLTLIQCSDLLSANACVIHRYDFETQTATIQARYGLPTEMETLETYPLGIDQRTQAILNREHFFYNDLGSSLRNSNSIKSYPDYQWKEMLRKLYQACLTVPLIVQDKVYGSLTFLYSQPQEFSADDISIATEFGDHAALAIENANLRSQAEQTAVAAERSRLARDLHDAVTQTLFSASLIAEVIPRVWEGNPAEGQQLLNDLQQLTRGALAEMRSLLLELRPTTMVELELGDLLKQLADAFSGRADIPVYLTRNGCSDSLPPEVKTALYRIAQEALNNIAKHSRASAIEMKLDCQVGQAVMEITDNGIGFDPNNISPDHLGVKIMRERAENIGADFIITSDVQEGTHISVTWREKDQETQLSSKS